MKSNKDTSLIIIYEKTHSSVTGNSRDSASDGPKGSLRGDKTGHNVDLDTQADGGTTLR